MNDLFNHPEISTMSQFDINEDYGVPYFWDGIAQWMNQHLGTPWKTGQEMIDAGVRYSCMEAGQHYGTIDEQFTPYKYQPGIEDKVWGSTKRKVAIVNGEVIGVDIIVGRVRTPNQHHRLLKVMSPECVDYFIEFPILKKSEIENNKKSVNA